MKNHPKNIGLSLLLSGILATLLFLGSCNNEPPTMCPRTGVGVLEGYLRVLGEGISARIEARALEGPQSGSRVAATVSDSTGWYRLELPTGLYQLEVNPKGSSSSTSELYDTIRVLPRVFRFDLKRSRAEVRIGVPDDVEDDWYYLKLRNEGLNSQSKSARVEEGFLVFEYPALVPAVYTMELSGGNLVDRYYLPGYSDQSDADFLEVELTAAAEYEVDFKDSYASISGSITGSWQLQGPGSLPGVHLFSPDSLWVGREVCDNDGIFTCGFLLPQAVLLLSDIRDVYQWVGGETFDTARVFDLQAGDRITGVSIVGSGINVLLDGPGDLTYHRPTITVRAESGEELHPDFSWSGPFTINNLRPGRYYLYLEGYCDDQIWTSQWYGGTEVFEGAAAIDLAEGELREIKMDLIRGGRIEGNLLRADGTRPRKIMFGLFDSAGDELCPEYRQWRQFDEGKFRFQGLADGDYFLGVQIPGGYWWYPGTGEFTEAVPLTIENHVDLIDIDWRLP